MGQSVSLSAVVGVWPDGRIVSHTFCGGVPSLIEREQADATPGLYVNARKRGELSVLDGLKVPPAKEVLTWVLREWGRPTGAILTDSFSRSNVEDAAKELGVSDLMEYRSRSVADVHDDIGRFRSAVRLGSFSRPDSLLLNAAMSRASVRTNSFGNMTMVRMKDAGARDDPAQALLLAWPEYERRASKPETESWALVG